MRSVLLVAAVVVLAGCDACQPSVTPLPSATDQSVYDALVAGHCLAPSDGGVAAVAAEHAGNNPLWLNCMYQPGASIQSCAVPCSK